MGGHCFTSLISKTVKNWKWPESPKCENEPLYMHIWSNHSTTKKNFQKNSYKKEFNTK
jgi:hypothetical protein